MGYNKCKILISFTIIILIFFVFKPIPENGESWNTVEAWSVTLRAIGPYSYPTGMKILHWADIENNQRDSILFNLSFIPKYPLYVQDFETGDYFIEGQEICAVKLYLDNLRNDENIIYNVTLTIMDPNGISYRNISFLDENFSGAGAVYTESFINEPIVFDIHGLWNFILRFNSSDDNYIWRCVGGGFYQTFMQKESKLSELNEIEYINVYREGVPIISISEALELSSLGYIGLQTKLLGDSVEKQKELADATFMLARFTAFMACASLAGAIFAGKSVIETRKLVIEIRRERKREKSKKITKTKRKKETK